jgi:hypothetical protein
MTKRKKRKNNPFIPITCYKKWQEYVILPEDEPNLET